MTRPLNEVATRLTTAIRRTKNSKRRVALVSARGHLRIVMNYLKEARHAHH